MAPHILLIGGHGKVSQLMTPLLLSRSWTVTCLIRDPAQSPTITALGKGQPGQLNVLVRSLEDVKSTEAARSILEETRPDYVVWSAGAGGKGGPTRTYAIDRDAAIHFITASIAITTITKFLLVSYNSCRRNRAPWWNEQEWALAEETNKGALKHYYAAKIEADECLTALAKQKGQGFQAIDLRPGYLTDEKPTGKVSLGKMGAKGSVTRGDVADVAVRLLEKEGARGWIDLLGGEEDVAQAVERVVREGIDCVEGEDVEEMVKRYPLK